MVLGLMSLLKGLQLLPNGMGGAMMSLDCIHGQVRRDFKEKMGFPGWFPTVLGLFKLTQAVLNWVADGAYVPVAQGLMAFQMGGVLFTHTIAEKPDGKSFMEKNAPEQSFSARRLPFRVSMESSISRPRSWPISSWVRLASAPATSSSPLVRAPSPHSPQWRAQTRRGARRKISHLRSRAVCDWPCSSLSTS